jgi:hypothetical protein
MGKISCFIAAAKAQDEADRRERSAYRNTMIAHVCKDKGQKRFARQHLARAAEDNNKAKNMKSIAGRRLKKLKKMLTAT